MLDRIAIGNTSDSKIAAITTRIITSAISMLMPICAPASSSSRWFWPQSQDSRAGTAPPPCTASTALRASSWRDVLSASVALMPRPVWRFCRQICEAPRRTFTSTSDSSGTVRAVRRGAGLRSRHVLDAELLGAGEAHVHRHLGVAAAELAQRRAAQRDADVLRDVLRR